ncbi:hypothetical protein IGB42_03532 [Andreprevotia sp. IGB-42]|uniref:HupE/UreJ family protein n=1 Tax=Andreprevotia sp. IGB-42 TaxID=2497473 RepID=UPI001357F520|nr:HupE/UreJ family protein [Andreprevotia sp. IGB-42]KAF0811990.1 hypothetical protein IGB42_03532 [Andreprevotia sp. IGB-42]
MRCRPSRQLAIAAVLLGSSSSCFAHAALQGAGDFYAGALHPLTSPEHMLPLLLTGLLAGQNGHKRMSFTLLLLPLALAAGAVMALLLPGLPGAFLVAMVLSVLLGALLAWARPLPIAVTAPLVLLCGVVVGYANGSAISADIHPAIFIAGLMAAGLLLQAYGMALISWLLTLPWGWVGIAVRVLGSWSIAIGLLVLTLSHRALLLS